MEKNDKKRYEGWSNYETWTVGVWLNSSEPAHRYWREKVEQYREEVSDSFRVREGRWTEAEALRVNLADQLMYEITDAAPIVAEFQAIRCAPYGPVRQQLLVIWRSVNRLRRTAGFETVPIEFVPWRRRIVRPFEKVGQAGTPVLTRSPLGRFESV